MTRTDASPANSSPNSRRKGRNGPLTLRVCVHPHPQVAHQLRPRPLVIRILAASFRPSSLRSATFAAAC
jgi:hypothetical protein